MKAFIREKLKFHELWKTKKSRYMRFLMIKIWQILKLFSRTLSWAQTSCLRRVDTMLRLDKSRYTTVCSHIVLGHISWCDSIRHGMMGSIRNFYMMMENPSQKGISFVAQILWQHFPPQPILLEGWQYHFRRNWVNSQ